MPLLKKWQKVCAAKCVADKHCGPATQARPYSTGLSHCESPSFLL